MVVGIIFQFADKFIEVRIEGTNCLFRTGQFGGAFSPIDGLQLNYAGVCREFPDLETKDNWKEIAIERFKDKMKELKTEDERVEYIKNDLQKFGYKPYAIQKEGFRIRRL